MMVATIAGPAGIIVLALAVVLIVIMVILHRRGGARVAGVIGAVLVIGGTLYLSIFDFLGLVPEVPSAEDRLTEVAAFLAGAAPGLLLGVGTVLVCIAAVTPPKAPEYHQS